MRNPYYTEDSIADMLRAYSLWCTLFIIWIELWWTSGFNTIIYGANQWGVLIWHRGSECVWTWPWMREEYIFFSRSEYMVFNDFDYLDAYIDHCERDAYSENDIDYSS